MPYKLSPNVACLVVRGPDRKLSHHYHGGGNGANRGPYIPFLDDEQRDHFLRLRLVEEVEDDESAPFVEPRPEPPADVVVNPEVVDECIKALDGADVPSDAGAPTARSALRDAGFRFGNDVIAAAVRQRKLRAA